VRARVDKSGRTSAGILLWRRNGGRLEVLLGHNGGPFWAKKDHGHWTVLKGEAEPGEELEAVARREFAEETSHELPEGPMIGLGEIVQKSGKLVVAWAVEGDLDPAAAVSNTFEMEWPPRSGRRQEFPEIDRIGWFGAREAMEKIIAYQRPLLVELQEKLSVIPAEPTGPG
jgi:predicted NUDIX family NTP pyrophosphohydrolase